MHHYCCCCGSGPGGRFVILVAMIVLIVLFVRVVVDATVSQILVVLVVLVLVLVLVVVVVVVVSHIFRVFLKSGSCFSEGMGGSTTDQMTLGPDSTRSHVTNESLDAQGAPTTVGETCKDLVK